MFGGNTGQEPVNDCCIISNYQNYKKGCLNVEKSPFTWVRLESKNEAPLARVYHSASLCNSGSANGMVVVFGGRSND